MTLEMQPDPIDPKLEAELVDGLRGELDAGAQAALDAKLSTDPALRARQQELAGLFQVERARFAEEAARAEADAPRLAAYIVNRVRSDEGVRVRRGTAVRSGRRRWARVLAVSIGLHVVVLGLLTWQLRGSESVDEPDRLPIVFEHGNLIDRFPDELAKNEQLGRVLGEMSPADLHEVPESVLLYDGGDMGPEIEPIFDELTREGGMGPGLRYPRGMDLQLARRSSEPLKRRRLAAVGMDADGTISRVRLGLSYLQQQQRADGSFPAEGAKSEMYVTSVALLAFLGEGRHSRLDGEAGDAVRQGIAWLRKAAQATPSALGEVGTREHGVALVTLCEDYMLAYGKLGIAEQAARASEIRKLRDLVVRAEKSVPADADPASEGRLWPVWALHAAERTDLVRRTPDQRARFDRWVLAAIDQEPGRQPATAGARTLAVLTQGTALLARERGGKKPGFLRWTEATASELLGGLLPNGKAKGSGSGARISETAVTLLALQTAYRSY